MKQTKRGGGLTTGRSPGTRVESHDNLIPRTRKLVAYVDVKSPQARLALGPTLAMAEESGSVVDWRPFHLKPRSPRKEADPTSRGARHRQARADYRRWELDFYARQQGIEWVYPEEELDSFAANAGLAWMKRQDAGLSQCDAYVRRVFAEVWAGRMDPGDRGAVEAAIVSAGGGSTGFGPFLDQQAGAELARAADEVRALGANDVPAYVVGDELYIGRAHLPVIRWWLDGQQGEPPV
ncbi:MAG: DsbA family protein [Gammaproteobacteria bacterium]|nr:DsbA family protein [Gammaproteobacteria bacterium]